MISTNVVRENFEITTEKLENLIAAKINKMHLKEFDIICLSQNYFVTSYLPFVVAFQEFQLHIALNAPCV